MYLDPGFGGMLVQLVVAFVAIGGALVFSFRKKIRAFITKGHKPNDVQRASTINENAASAGAKTSVDVGTDAGAGTDDGLIDTLSDEKK